MKRLCRTVYTTGARLSFAFIHDPCICTSISTPTHLPGRSFPAHGGELACLLMYSRLFQIHFTHHSLAEHTAPKLYTAGRFGCLLFLTCGISSLLHSDYLILFIVLLIHLILRIITSSQSPTSLSPSVTSSAFHSRLIISFTNLFLRSLLIPSGLPSRILNLY